MPEPTQQPVVPDVSRQLSGLTEAVNRLIATQQAQTASPAEDLSGEPHEGEALAPGVDYSKLSAVQQIALGLRSAGPAAPTARAGAD